MFIVKKLSDNSKEFLDTFYNIVDQLNDSVDAVEPTKSISETYINQLVPLLQAGVKMNDNILKYTTNVDIENFAKNMNFDLNNEIEKLNQMKESCSCTCNNERDLKLYNRRFKELFNNTIQRLNNTPATNNVDAFYLTTMIIHHEGTIATAKNALSYTLCPELKELLMDIVDEQNLQISTMKGLLKNII